MSQNIFPSRVPCTSLTATVVYNDSIMDEFVYCSHHGGDKIRCTYKLHIVLIGRVTEHRDYLSTLKNVFCFRQWCVTYSECIK